MQVIDLNEISPALFGKHGELSKPLLSCAECYAGIRTIYHDGAAS